MYRTGEIYDDIKKTIIDIYIDYGIAGFPVDETCVCRKMGVALIPYTSYGKEDRKLLLKKSQHGFYVPGTADNSPTIFYNDLYESKGAQRLTVFHELKHYVYEDCDDEDDDLVDFFSKLKSGGHGQAGMDLLDRLGITYNVVKAYSNGVRVGNVPGHKDPNKRVGIGQAWFPKTWTEKDIRKAGEHVAGLKCNRRVPNGKTIFGVYKGVRVGVIRTNGKIATVFPDSEQASVLKRRK